MFCTLPGLQIRGLTFWRESLRLRRRDAVDEIQAISVALTVYHYTPRRSNRLRLWMEEEEEEGEEVFTSLENRRASKL